MFGNNIPGERVNASQTHRSLNALEEEHTKYIWRTAKRRSGGRERAVGDDQEGILLLYMGV